MDIKEELDKLNKTRDDIQTRMKEDKENLSRLNSTIKQLEKLSGKVQELIEESPVIQSDAKLIVNISNGLQ